MTTLHDQIAEALLAARTGLCEWPAFGDDEKDVVLLAKIDAALSRLDALAAEVAELRGENGRLAAILRAPGGCCNCGDSDPFRVGKWGISSSDAMHASFEAEESAAKERDK
jgi:hypothetical protein